MKNKNITFFIENDSHYRFSNNLINSLKVNNNIRIIALKELGGVFKAHKNIKLEVFNNSKDFINALINLESDYFFTTTPGINNSNFPKSKIIPKSKRPKYIYLFHALVSPNEMYVKNSFKNFDYIISPSKIVSNQLKYLISKNTKILDFGFILFDQVNKFSYDSYKNSVLIAPSWGSEGLLEQKDIINNLVEQLSKVTSEIVLRPHPMHYEKIKNYEDLNLNLDLNLDLQNLHSYKFLITDCSGIALEFFTLTGRPVLFIDVPKKIKRKISHKEKALKLIEDDMKNIIGSSIKPNEISSKSVIPKISDLSEAESFIDEVCLSKNVVHNIVNFNYQLSD